MSHPTPAPSIFESFNARALSPRNVAETFVPSQQYDRLSKRAHSLIVGPRGSGKTTLLKMLQIPALDSWQHPLAEGYRHSIDFTGVFVPADVSWGAQLDSLGYGKLDEAGARLLSVAAFTTHVLRALIIAIEQRTRAKSDSTESRFRTVILKPQNEAHFVREISQSWEVGPPIPTVSALRFALTRRLSQIREVGSREATLGNEGRPKRLAGQKFLHLHFLEAASIAVELFDDVSEGSSGKWALLFDEMELAPDWVRQELLRSLRSADDRFLFKLSMSPFTKEPLAPQQPATAMPGNDFEVIPLWYAHKEDGYPFCRSLFDAMMKEKELAGVGPERVFGTSVFDLGREQWQQKGTAYSSGSPIARRFERMREADPSFREYLRLHHLDPKQFDRLKPDERAAEVRKVSPLLAIREEFRSPHDGGGGQAFRSRKIPTVYAGASSLFAMVEGNPRWFIGVIGQMIDKVQTEQIRVPPARQVREILETANRFRALLRTIPSPGLRTGGSQRGILSVLDRIGEHFHRSTVVDDFTAEPPGSFIVDSRSSPELMEALGKALNAGAIVYVPEDEGDLLLSSLRGKRFRICYLLSPQYKIPIRLGRAISLGHILVPEQQPTLFTAGESSS